MLDLIPSLSSWAGTLASEQFAVATIVAATGSVPRPVGTAMLVSGTGAILGSLSGGCVEGAVVALAEDAIADGGSRQARFGFSSTDAFAAGLTCGGELEIHVEPILGQDHPLRGVLMALATVDPDQPVGLVRVLPAGNASGTAASSAALSGTDAPGRAEGMAALVQVADLGAASRALSAILPQHSLASVAALLRAGGTGVLPLTVSPVSGQPPTQAGTCPADLQTSLPASDVPLILVESRVPPPRLLVFGANDFGAALLPVGKLLGYHVTLVDARPAFAAQPRFGMADEVVTQWPHHYLAAEAAASRLDSRSVVAVLSHDPKFDIPLLEAALALDLAYVGAMGSRRSHLQRVDDLLNTGIAPERIARLHSPIGLDLGAETPAEVAVSITAELIAARSAASTGMPLREASGPIHHAPPTPFLSAVPEPLTQQEIAWT
ncbi:putative xanthine dehydrogenase subunit A [Arthrobacter ulcerisalmonis]|uniref:Putative xanthine dehydrogenase subunit A n=1 Tax=Arthrobacter ulcerisalmonis TaxID=2483813 RepID=A0A3P5WP45_9MICC|nr:XdhC/CoxI family protein [Arthrobacter ulcerisalmonis]VDC22752.1 putative xanthine dehydrogenase subunit A [Arthrobacter ulcerisalmonis]